VVDNAEKRRCLLAGRRADVSDRGGDPTSVEIAYVIERGHEDPHSTGHSSMMPDRERAAQRGHAVGGGDDLLSSISCTSPWAAAPSSGPSTKWQGGSRSAEQRGSSVGAAVAVVDR